MKIDDLESSEITAEEEVEYLRGLLEEAVGGNLEIRKQYETHLDGLRQNHQAFTIRFKSKLLRHVQHVVSSYRKLAKDAITIAKKEREKVQEDRAKTYRLTETACKNFERDLKDKTKAALEEYKCLAKTAHDVAQQERASLRSRCDELERAVENERLQFEAHIIREAERRVTGYRHGHGQAQELLEKERMQSSAAFEEIHDRVTAECVEFESFLIRTVVQLFLENGVDMTEAEVIEYIKKSHDKAGSRLLTQAGEQQSSN
eukprot:GHVQ01015931.1.p1 GENE.GHVQ01015931.1~~GHVQ01015931.1.p1  ORF type:complete len:260 (-),score=44.89 GHVQ01015931.1:1608-2387(-)